MKVLFIEDDKELAETLKEELESYFTVDLAFSGEEGEYTSFVNGYDIIIIDYNLPGINGIEVCKKIRESHIATPILMLTGEVEVAKKIEALNSGVDDYLTKPFVFGELLARIKALLRRPPQTMHSNIISIGDLIIDLDNQKVSRKGKQINLRKKEFHLLEYLARNVGQVITREMILDHVWESLEEPVTNTIDVHIKYLRDHIDKEFDKKLIKTVHGMGYKLEG
jgi:two-component system copper resistance phosphate regulon response regulator CusR